MESKHKILRFVTSLFHEFPNADEVKYLLDQNPGSIAICADPEYGLEYLFVEGTWVQLGCEKGKESIMYETRDSSNLGTVKSLGSGHTEYKDIYSPELLETFDNRHPDNDYVVTFDGYEGTSLCPITHQPDFFKVVISYIPNKKMVESKSLKLYLFSFRNTGSFHEDIVNSIGKDLVKLMEPKYLEVKGIFSPRGGISIFPSYFYSTPEYEYIEKQRRLDTLRDNANRAVKYDN